jgi:hypothetical protein
MMDDLDKQIAATQVEFGLVKAQTSSFKTTQAEFGLVQAARTSSFNILHALVNFNFASTKPKPTTPSTTKGQQESPEESDDLDFLDFQIAQAKADLNQIQLEGDHYRYRRELQTQKSQDNLKKKARALQTSIKLQRKAPDSATRQIVEHTFNEPSRNRFCMDMEIKNVHSISSMWWMNRQLDLQLDALDDLNELLDLERTTLQGEAHKNRAQMLMLTKIDPLVEKKTLQLDALEDLNELLDLERTTLQGEAHKNRAQMIMQTKIDPLVEKKTEYGLSPRVERKTLDQAKLGSSPSKFVRNTSPSKFVRSKPDQSILYSPTSNRMPSTPLLDEDDTARSRSTTDILSSPNTPSVEDFALPRCADIGAGLEGPNNDRLSSSPRSKLGTSKQPSFKKTPVKKTRSHRMRTRQTAIDRLTESKLKLKKEQSLRRLLQEADAPSPEEDSSQMRAITIVG